MSASSVSRLLALACALALPALLSHAGPQVDPREMERAPRVPNPGPVDARIVGAWDVWIPGAVYYSSDGRQVYQHYQPGAAMNRLDITADGRYRWGSRSERLEEVRPWHHQSGRRYYRIAHASGTEYDFHYGDGDKLVVLFGGVGGHAATGTRLAGSGNDHSTPASAASFAPGAQVEVEWNGRWFPARILKVDGGRYLVSYDGYGSNWDEWVAPARARPRPGSSSPSPAADKAGHKGSAKPASNPLGVEWQGAADPRPSTHAPSANGLGAEWRESGSATTTGTPANPLGVEWVGVATPPANPAPSRPPSGARRPDTPATPPPSPQAGSTPPRPNPTTPDPIAKTSLVDRWLYQAVAFHDANGRVTSEHRDVRGDLTLVPDGNYVQNLTIGGILNAIKGRYQVAGDRVITHYTWRGQPASDDMSAHLSADGETLTLVRQGSPVVYYTLKRAE